MVKKFLAYFFFIILFSSLFAIFSVESTTNSSIIFPHENTEGITLTIVTKHDVTIAEEFKERFLATPEAIALNITDIDFKYSITTDGWKKLLEDPSKSVDIAWGGDPFWFNSIDNLSLLYHINPNNDSELFSTINDSVRSYFYGQPMKKFSITGDLIWAADTYMAYGFTVNHEFLDSYGLPIPSTWEELGTPTYYISNNVEAIALTDPPLSTLHNIVNLLILQVFGWDEGWKILTRIGANAEYYWGIVTPWDLIVNDEIGIVVSADVLGYRAHKTNPNCEYIIPEEQSMILADPIALSKNVDDYAAAAAFLKYVYSPVGQATWLTDSISRLPINESAFFTPEGAEHFDLYFIYNQTLFNEPEIVFDESYANNMSDISCYYYHNTISKNHDLLRQTWGELITQFNNGNITSTEYLDLYNSLGEPCLTEGEAVSWNSQFTANPEFAANLESSWEEYARLQYQTILDNLTPTTTSNTKTISAGFIFSIFSLFLLRRNRRKIPSFNL